MKLNKEEERKAFEATVLTTGLFKAVEWNGERYTMNGGLCMTQDYFEVWCKAKEHSEEMAKPAVHIRKSMSPNYPFVVVHNDGVFKGVIIEAFTTHNSATKWAIGAGYRVVGQ